jgi:hypothetical protein
MPIPTHPEANRNLKTCSAECGSLAKLRCSKCLVTYFCSVSCQKKYWLESHKKECSQQTCPDFDDIYREIKVEAKGLDVPHDYVLVKPISLKKSLLDMLNEGNIMSALEGVDMKFTPGAMGYFSKQDHPSEMWERCHWYGDVAASWLGGNYYGDSSLTIKDMAWRTSTRIVS